MRLYLILADDDNGDSLDWFVWARTVADARKLWAQSRIDPGWEGEDAETEDDFYPHIRRVYEVDLNCPDAPGVVDWGKLTSYLKLSNEKEAY